MKKIIFKNNTWHFVIPFVVLTGLIPLYYIFLPFQWAHMWLFASLLGLIAVQFFYEWKEFTDPRLLEKYGSYENFIKNTKKDIRLFSMGVFMGILAGFLVYSILEII